MKVFDISKNMISGSLYDVNILPNPNSSQYHADINRLSGPLSTSTIQLFPSVSILKGGLFSCTTLPSNDKELQEYTCGSQGLEFSIYYYCIFVAVVISLILYCYYTKYEFVAQIYSKWRLESSITNITSNDEIKSMLPSTMYILDSIERLRKVGYLLSAVIVVVGFVIYASLKYGAQSHIFKTHLHQYQYVISGVYLQTSAPAFTLFVFHTAVVCIIIYAFFRVFDYDWKVLSFGRDSIVKTSAENPNVKPCQGWSSWTHPLVT